MSRVLSILLSHTDSPEIVFGKLVSLVHYYLCTPVLPSPTAGELLVGTPCLIHLHSQGDNTMLHIKYTPDEDLFK